MFRQVSYDANGGKEDLVSVQAAIEITLENRNSNPSRTWDNGKNFAGVLIWDPVDNSKVARAAAMSEAMGFNGHSERVALRGALEDAKNIGLFVGIEVPVNLPVVKDGIESFLPWKKILEKFNVCVFTERKPCEGNVRQGEITCADFLDRLLALSEAEANHKVFYAIPPGDRNLKQYEQKEQVDRTLMAVLPYAFRTLNHEPGPPLLTRHIQYMPEGMTDPIAWVEEELKVIAAENLPKQSPAGPSFEAGPSTNPGQQDDPTSSDSFEFSSSDEEVFKQVELEQVEKEATNQLAVAVAKEDFENPVVNPLLVFTFSTANATSTAQSQQMENQGFSKGIHFPGVPGSPKAQKSPTPSPPSSPSPEEPASAGSGSEPRSKRGRFDRDQ
jgi:hypothetical protein